MNDHRLDKITWHIRAFWEWAQAVGELFPALWDAAKTFAPLVIDYCDVCHKPITIAWVPVGDHDLCDKLADPADSGALYVNDSPLPPI